MILSLYGTEDVCRADRRSNRPARAVVLVKKQT